jgi:hypothetical protein
MESPEFAPAGSGKMALGATASTRSEAPGRPRVRLLTRLNESSHKSALWIFTGVVLAHWAEHLGQAFQVYVLRWPIPEARGVLGLWFPWLVRSEALHYAYALIMLVGIWSLRAGFKGRAHRWWMIAFWIQFWHHIEHALLQGQAIFQHNLWGRPMPVSLVQLWIPRVELHLFYNTIVFIPMVIAMYYHVFPSAPEAAQHRCSCAIHHRRLEPATA